MGLMMNSLPKIIILQKGYPSPVENSAVIVTCAQNDIDLIRQSYETIAPIKNALPVGSVEFIRRYMELSDIKEPENISYPDGFKEYYKRNIAKILSKDTPWDVFVKPVRTKDFNGFVNTKPKYNLDRDILYGRSQEVWISDIVEFLAEWRVYISNYRVIGIARYDDRDEEYEDNLALLFANELAEMKVIKYGSIDVGLTKNGYSIVECNDAWSLGLYKGSISQRDYISMLWGRWQELIKGYKNS